MIIWLDRLVINIRLCFRDLGTANSTRMFCRYIDDIYLYLLSCNQVQYRRRYKNVSTKRKGGRGILFRDAFLNI